MRIHENEVYAFALGSAISWLAAYTHLTHEKRLSKSLRSQIDYIGGEHNLRHHEIAKIIETVSDQQLLSLHKWAKDYSKKMKARKPPIRISSYFIVAEVVICEEALGLTRAHALRALIRATSVTDLLKNLRDVVGELRGDERFPVDETRWSRFVARIPTQEPKPEPRVPMVPL